MACKAEIRQVEDIAIVDLSGRITLGDGSGTIRDTVKSLVEKGQKKILLNLAGITYVDSAGLGELVGAFATVRNQNGQIKLLNAQNKVRDVLQITKLYTVFDIFDSENTALISFRSKSASA